LQDAGVFIVFILLIGPVVLSATKYELKQTKLYYENR